MTVDIQVVGDNKQHEPVKVPACVLAELYKILVILLQFYTNDQNENVV